MGLPNEIIDKSIRISFSRFNTKEDVDLLASSLDELVKTHCGKHVTFLALSASGAVTYKNIIISRKFLQNSLTSHKSGNIDIQK